MFSRDHPAETQSHRGPMPSMAPGGRVSVVGTEHYQVVLHRRRRAAALGGPWVLGSRRTGPRAEQPQRQERDRRVHRRRSRRLHRTRHDHVAARALERCVKAGRAPTCAAAFVLGGPMARGQVGVDLDVALDRSGWPKAA